MDILSLISTVSALFSQPWVWLILFASLLYATGNYIDELLLSKYEQEVGTLVLISTLFGGIVALVFYCIATFADVTLWLAWPILLQALAVGVLEALWVIPYLYATERSGAIVAGPLFQAVPVFALGMEAFLGVIPPAIQIIGALLIVGGGILVSIEQEENEDGDTKRTIDWTAIWLMCLSAILVALIYVLFRDAAVATNFVAIGFWVGLGTLLTGTAIYFVWQPYRQQFTEFCSSANYKAVAIQLGNEILDAGGVYMTNLANTLGPSVMVVTAFNATQPLFIGLIGFLLTVWGVSSVSTARVQGGLFVLLCAGIGLIAVGVLVLALGTVQ